MHEYSREENEKRMQNMIRRQEQGRKNAIKWLQMAVASLKARDCATAEAQMKQARVEMECK